MSDVIEVRQLVKRYGPVAAVDGVSFSVAQGEVVGMLGPNGAGKTTTIEILEGLRSPTDGQVRVLGRDPARGGRRLKSPGGVGLQSAGSDRALTVTGRVGAYAGLYRRRRPLARPYRCAGASDPKALSCPTPSRGGRLDGDAQGHA